MISWEKEEWVRGTGSLIRQETHFVGRPGGSGGFPLSFNPEARSAGRQGVRGVSPPELQSAAGGFRGSFSP